MPTAATPADGEKYQNVQRRHKVKVVLWSIGLILFILSCFVIHAHPKPFAFDLATTEAVQGAHLWPWVDPVLSFPSILNNPLPSIIALGCWFVGMMVMALIFRLRGKSPLGWVLPACSLVLVVLIATGLQGVVEELVARPRPDPHIYPIHVYTPLVPFPTYPSGHTEHDVVYYGFLLYLSFTRAVREWRYHRLLLPLQIFALIDILTIGYSRILLGDHWLTDSLGGYLEGLLYLFLFIFLYRWATNVIAERRAKKLASARSVS